MKAQALRHEPHAVFGMRAGPVQRPEAGEPLWGDLGGVQSVGQEQAGRHLLQDPLAHGPCTESGPPPPRLQFYPAPFSSQLLCTKQVNATKAGQLVRRKGLQSKVSAHGQPATLTWETGISCSLLGL